MRRNVKFAGMLCRKWDELGNLYCIAIVNQEWEEAERINSLAQRIRNVLEFRYNTIV